ncbi:flagellar hook protein FlgE [Pseudoroseicyclus aestuarii]|uniref:Flagellar hook protein FlgE n=1 Tax=Pseudoroseicyclus aestuarii TaxID=1795041 RepID=A0A318T2D0_9RHOB|nr:flagellar hook-basal body complex protein [Pseudoroseicyclus aestuarii]PYE84374.1 flagellar hook protein FlgE [Pseudoroseicyclus aestuarii]
MSISSAMQTGVSGLKAYSTSVGKISDNIANANTDGYHRSFAQMVTSTTGPDAPAGVRAVAGTDVGNAGALRPTDRATDLALQGDGFFLVSKTPNDPVASNYFLTRAGSFTADSEGNLVNAAGYYLSGWAMGEDGTTGTVDRNGIGSVSTVNLAGQTVQGSASTEMALTGNLPSQETGLAQPGDPFVSTAEYFTPLGEAERLTMSWQPGADDNSWTLTLSDAEGAALGSVDVTFANSGPGAGAPLSYSNATNLATAPAGFAFDPATGTATLTLDNGDAPQPMTLSLGAPGSFDGLTQFAGDYALNTPAVDGAEAGALQRTEIANGIVYGVFDNGTRSALFEIPVAQVANVDGLEAQDGNAYRTTIESGDWRLGNAGSGSLGTIASGALESSNVDIAEELTDLIATQRAYSTSAKIITTADEMLEVTTQLKR